MARLGTVKLEMDWLGPESQRHELAGNCQATEGLTGTWKAKYDMAGAWKARDGLAGTRQAQIEWLGPEVDWLGPRKPEMDRLEPGRLTAAWTDWDQKLKERWL